MKVLLYSGGMDSFLIRKIWKPDLLLYINIGGAYNKEEIRRLPAETRVVNFPWLGSTELENRFVPLRNLYFMMIASYYGDEICLGATAGDWGNRDKTPEFLENSEKMLNYLWGDKKVNRNVSVCRDFINVPKSELIKRFLECGNDINDLKEETFSCYTPDTDGKECMDCYPCFRKFALLYSFGASYPEETEKKMWDYIKKNIIPTANEGGYKGTYYTDRGEESEYLIKAVNMLKDKYG